MDRNECRFTVLFQPPFWVGIGERWTEEGYQAARVVFGAEPSDAQVYQWVLTSWHSLPFTAVEAGERPRAVPANPKRLQREAAKAARTAGASTKAQEALARQREADGLEALCGSAARLLRNGGRFALCARPERLPGLFAALGARGLEPKRLQLAAHSPAHRPSLALVEAVRQGRPGLEVLPLRFARKPSGVE